MRKLILTSSLVGLLAISSHAKVPVLIAPDLLQELKVKPLKVDMELGIAYAQVDENELMKVSMAAHNKHRCAGFERLDNKIHTQSIDSIFEDLRKIKSQEAKFRHIPLKKLEKSEVISAALQEVDPKNLEDTVRYLSSFSDRYNRGAKANDAVEAMKGRMENMIASANRTANVKIDLISHRSTIQKSIRVRLEGSQNSEQIVVLGGHIDSINQFFGKAPGADDNGSGTSNLVETLRILLKQPQPKKSIEIFFYAGEESGLLGSAEIAAQYKADKKQVQGVLQLDMTLHPGAGEFVVSNIDDFTSPELKQILEEINSHYIQAKLVKDECGYACSDHASWYRNGFKTVFPFETPSDVMNKNIHTTKDVINNESSFKHSAMFAKYAIAFALTLANEIN